MKTLTIYTTTALVVITEELVGHFSVAVKHLLKNGPCSAGGSTSDFFCAEMCYVLLYVTACEGTFCNTATTIKSRIWKIVISLYKIAIKRSIYSFKLCAMYYPEQYYDIGNTEFRILRLPGIGSSCYYRNVFLLFIFLTRYSKYNSRLRTLSRLLKCMLMLKTFSLQFRVSLTYSSRKLRRGRLPNLEWA